MGGEPRRRATFKKGTKTRPSDARIYTTTFDSLPSVPKSLIELPRAHIPLTLPVLGHILTPKCPTPITVFTSFDLEAGFDLLMGLGEKALWSIGTYSVDDSAEGDKRNDYIRFFCSEETNRSREGGAVINRVEEHVRAFMAAWIPLLHATAANHGRFWLGSLHSLWVPYVQEYAADVLPCFKFIRPPSPAPTHDSQMIQEGHTITHLTPSDIPRTVATSHIPRSLGYMTSRLQYSVCVRSARGEREGWGLIHGDGSIGGLFIEAEFRRLGLAKVIVDELAKIDLTDADERVKPHGPGIFGWYLADVVQTNDKGRAFFEAAEDWGLGWTTSWIPLKA